MNYYYSINELWQKSRCLFARKTEYGWVAKRTAKGATHRIHPALRAYEYAIDHRSHGVAVPLKETKP